MIRLAKIATQVFALPHGTTQDFRIHDLRHTFASPAVASGQGLPMIGKLLGHTQVQTTAHYAHLATDPVEECGRQRVKRAPPGDGLIVVVEFANKHGPGPPSRAPAQGILSARIEASRKTHFPCTISMLRQDVTGFQFDAE